MKLIIAGGRNLHVGVDGIEEAVKRFISCSGIRVTEVVCGLAHGVDADGLRWGKRNKLPVIEFPALWTHHGLSAGPKRNQAMVDYADALLLIWNGKSRGSADVKRAAEKRGIPVFEVLKE